MKSSDVREFVQSKANLAGMALASLVELTHLFGFIDSFSIFLAVIGYGLGYSVMYTKKDKTCPEGLTTIEQIQWGITTLENENASEDVLRTVKSFAARLLVFLEQIDPIKGQALKYAKIHSEANSLVLVWFIPAIEAYFKVPLKSAVMQDLNTAIMTQIKIMTDILDKLEKQAAEHSMAQINSSTKALEQLLNEKS